MKKEIEAGAVTTQKAGAPVAFPSKRAQAVEMLGAVAAPFVDRPIRVVTDNGFGHDGLWRPWRDATFTFDIRSRRRAHVTLHARPMQRAPHPRGRAGTYGEKLGSVSALAADHREKARPVSVFLYGKRREVLADSPRVRLKNLRCPVRVVWVFRKTRAVAFFTTDLSLSFAQIIEDYGARWKIVSGFKQIKQEIGSARSQTRPAQAVTHHRHFCTRAATLTGIYADRLEVDPQRRHLVKGRTRFTFSDVRRLIAKAALSEDVHRLWPTPRKPQQNDFVSLIRRMAA